ncbi:TetR-like C-terminal domain-containing protein [Nocardia sp. NPDC046763]|uniref:TetR-like C-terminal domain-containing protein n=1 Tax=Nocardia sp. NPDC046763 TaxID=3155256 RepID=UPI0033C4AC3B
MTHGARFWAERYRLVGPIRARAAERGELPTGTDTRMALELLIAPIRFRAMLTREPAGADYVDRLAGYVTRAFGPDPAHDRAPTRITLAGPHDHPWPGPQFGPARVGRGRIRFERISSWGSSASTGRNLPGPAGVR